MLTTASINLHVVTDFSGTCTCILRTKHNVIKQTAANPMRCCFWLNSLLSPRGKRHCNISIYVCDSYHDRLGAYSSTVHTIDPSNKMIVCVNCYPWQICECDKCVNPSKGGWQGQGQAHRRCHSLTDSTKPHVYVEMKSDLLSLTKLHRNTPVQSPPPPHTHTHTLHWQAPWPVVTISSRYVPENN